MSFNIEVEGGTSVRLPTAGKYCDRDIVVTATGGGGGGSNFMKTLFEQGIFRDESTTEMCSDCFRGWQYIKQIDMPNVKSINQYACYNCTGLTAIDFPLCETIGNYTFYNNTDVASINMPKLTTTGTNAFRQLTSLVGVKLPLLTDINGTVFQKCTLLEKADFPSAKSLGANAFNGCEALVTLIFRSNQLCTMANVNALASTPIENGTGYVYFPKAWVDAQKSASNWSIYAAQIRAIEDYPEITGG